MPSLNSFPIFAALGLMGSIQSGISALSYTGYGVLVTQSFDTLGNAGTIAWTNDSTIPGWELYNGDLAPLTAIVGGNGAANSGSYYSFGTTGAPDRALGAVGSGAAYFGSPSTGGIAGWLAVSFVNSTSHLMDTITISYSGEQWRNGGNTTAQSLTMEYGVGATFAGATWTAAGSAFNFTSPVATATAAAVDGNVAGRINGIGGTISSVSWPAGSTLWVRWADLNDSGNDHGLAVDDFTFVAVPEPSVSGLLLAALGLAVRRRR